MIIETLIVSIIWGKIKGGKINRLAEISLNKWGFILIGFLLSNVSIYLITKGNVFLLEYFAIIQLISNLLLILTIYFNRKIKEFLVVGFGIGLNTLVMVFNGGRMPVSEWALEKVGLEEELSLIINDRIVTHTIMDTSTTFGYLSDIIPLIYKVISFGDVFMAFGIFLIIRKYMNLSKPLQRK